jgi:hypothetical protein
MLSRSIENIQPQWATRNRMPHIIGAGLVALIVACSSISAHGQQGSPGPAPVQGGAPAHTFSPAPPAVSPPAPIALPQIESAPQPLAPAPGAPPTALERSETLPAASGAPAPADRSADTAPTAEEGASTILPRDLTPYGMFMSADIIVKAVMLGLIFASVLTGRSGSPSLWSFSASDEASRARNVGYVPPVHSSRRPRQRRRQVATSAC